MVVADYPNNGTLKRGMVGFLLLSRLLASPHSLQSNLNTLWWHLYASAPSVEGGYVGPEHSSFHAYSLSMCCLRLPATFASGGHPFDQCVRYGEITERMDLSTDPVRMRTVAGYLFHIGWLGTTIPPPLTAVLFSQNSRATESVLIMVWVSSP